MRTFFLYLDGEPVAKGRPRASIRTKADGTSYPRMHTPAKTSAAEAMLWATFKDRYPGTDPLDEPFALTMRFFEGQRQPEKWQDLDNLVKTVMDALNGHAWVDDRLCTLLTAVVVRGAAKPHTEVDVRTLSPYELITNRGEFPREGSAPDE